MENRGLILVNRGQCEGRRLLLLLLYPLLLWLLGLLLSDSLYDSLDLERFRI